MLRFRQVVGNSMLPTLRQGMFVVGVSNFRTVQPGDVVIVNHNGLEKIKRIQKVSSDKVFLLGDNPKQSTDSRQLGWLPRETVRAKVVWPRT